MELRRQRSVRHAGDTVRKRDQPVGAPAKQRPPASGATLDRPNPQRAIAAARAGKFDVLFVYRVDRFSRRTRDRVALLDELDQAGVCKIEMPGYR